MAWRQSPGGSEQHLIPDCGDTDPSAAPSALSMPPISHWTTVGFCNGCPGGAARSMSQGLRVLVSLVPLPPRAPELTGQENIWQFMRQNWLSNRIFKSFDDIVDHCCYAWNTLIDQPWKIMSIARRDWAAVGHSI